MTSKSCGINYVSFSFRFEVSWPMKKGWIFRSSKPRSFHQWNDALAWTTPQFLAVQAMQDVELLWWHLRGAWSWKMDRMMMFLPYHVPHQDRRETTIVQRNEEKQKVQTFLCWGFAGVNILGGFVSKLRAPKTSSICYQNSDNLRCYLRATYPSWN